MYTYKTLGVLRISSVCSVWDKEKTQYQVLSAHAIAHTDINLNGLSDIDFNFKEIIILLLSKLPQYTKIQYNKYSNVAMIHQ